MLSLKHDYHAGNQGDFHADGRRDDAVIRKYGCGLIGLADLLIYLGKETAGQAPERKNGAEDRTENAGLAALFSAGGGSEAAYRELVRRLDAADARVRGALGLNGFAMARAFNRLAAREGLRFSARWSVPEEKLLAELRRMLDGNIPAVFSIGPNLVPWRKNAGVNFYADPEKKDPHVLRVRDHYVTVTGLAETGDRRMLRISSWGQTYYVDFDEYLQYVQSQPPFFGALFSNLLSVKPAGK